jgi:hypothetical protein
MAKACLFRESRVSSGTYNWEPELRVINNIVGYRATAKKFPLIISTTTKAKNRAERPNYHGWETQVKVDMVVVHQSRHDRGPSAFRMLSLCHAMMFRGLARSHETMTSSKKKL